MIQGTTSTGFAYEIDEGMADDMELLENLIRLDKKDMTALPQVMEGVLGDSKAALYEHCRGESGRVSVRGVMQEVQEIFAAAGQNVKN